MENRTPLKELPLLNGRKYLIRTKEDGQPMITYGGSGILYFVNDVEKKRRMVIKELFPRTCAYRKADGNVDAAPGKRDVFEHYREAFRNEAERLCSAATATHHVKGDFEIFDGRFAVMREMPEDTKSLMEVIPRRVHIPNEENLLWAISVVKRILEAVEKLHQQEEILHLDLSLANVFVSNDKTGPEAYILDFGNCLEMQGAHSCSVQNLSYRPSGSAQFEAPELENGSFTEFTPSADLFSIGLIFLHLLCGHRGYYANKEIHEADVLVGNHRYIERALDSLNFSPAEKKAIFDFILRTIEYHPENRFQTAASMLQAVEEMESTISRKGISHNALWAGSLAYHQKLWKDDYDPDLFVDAVSCDFTDHQYLYDENKRNFHWGHHEKKLIDIIKENNCLLISNGGTAKTTYLHRLFGQLLEARSKDENAPVPVFVDLQKYRNLKDQQHYILDEILDHYFAEMEHSEITRKLILNTLAEGSVLILDSYNEAVAPEMLDAQISELKNKKIRIVIASRYAMEQKLYTDFARANMEKLSGIIVLNKLQEHNLSLPDERIMELLFVPQYLIAYLEADKNKAITSAGMLIMERMRTISNQAGLVGHHDEAALREYGLEIFLPLIATRIQSMIFDFETAEQILLDSPKDRRYAAITSKENLCFRLLRAMLNCGILGYSRNKYRFTHQNYRDVLCALHIGNQIRNKIVPKELTLEILQPEVAAFLGDVLEENYAVTRIYAPSPVRVLLDTMKYSCGGKNQMAIANLVFVLAIARNFDLHGVSFDGLDLRFADFRGCNLLDASFRKTKLSCLSLTTVGHQGAIENIHVVPASGLLATWCSDETDILFWDPEGRLVKSLRLDLEGYTLRAASVCFSPNGKLVMVLSPENLSLYEIKTGTKIAQLPQNLFSSIFEEVFERFSEQHLQVDDYVHKVVHVSFAGNRQLMISTLLFSFCVDFRGNFLGMCRFFLPTDVTAGLESFWVSDHGKTLYCATKDQIIRYKAKTVLPREGEILLRERGPAERLAVSADGQTFRMGYTFDGADDSFFNGNLEEIALSGYGAGCISNRFIAKCGRNAVYWRPTKELDAAEHSVPVHGAFRLAISNDEKELYVATYNCEILVFSLETGELLRTFMIGRKYVLYSDTRYPYLRKFAKNMPRGLAAISVEGADFRSADMDEILKDCLRANGAIV